MVRTGKIVAQRLGTVVAEKYRAGISSLPTYSIGFSQQTSRCSGASSLANSKFLAADLMSQAEHDRLASEFCLPTAKSSPKKLKQSLKSR